jgi:hypothetical protein
MRKRQGDEPKLLTIESLHYQHLGLGWCWSHHSSILGAF